MDATVGLQDMTLGADINVARLVMAEVFAGEGINGGRNMGQGGGVTMYQWLGGSLST